MLVVAVVVVVVPAVFWSLPGCRVAWDTQCESVSAQPTRQILCPATPHCRYNWPNISTKLSISTQHSDHRLILRTRTEQPELERREKQWDDGSKWSVGGSSVLRACLRSHQLKVHSSSRWGAAAEEESSPPSSLSTSSHPAEPGCLIWPERAQGASPGV